MSDLGRRILATTVEVELGVYGSGHLGLGGLLAVGVPRARSHASTEDLPLPRGTSETVMVIEKEQGVAID